MLGPKRSTRGVALVVGVTACALVAIVPQHVVAQEVAAPDAAAGVAADAAADAGWILFAQTPSGAIATHADRTYVDPYLGALAAAGLTQTGDPVHADAAWRFVEWYAESMDAAGYVHDYTVLGEELAPAGEADSTDAYAAAFLVATAAAHDALPDRARLDALAPALHRAVDAIRSTQRPDGLTGSKPTFMVAYLMDQAEVYAGLLAAARLGRELRDRELTRNADGVTRELRLAVRELWNPATEAFDWAVHPDGARDPTDWSQLYPDALSQVWAVRYGLVDGARARGLLRQFLATHPNAHDPAAVDLVDGGYVPGGYWTGIGTVLGTIDPDAPARYLAGTTQAAAASSRAWPYSVRTAGEAVQVAQHAQRNR